MVDTNKCEQVEKVQKEIKLPCGCIYKDQGWMLTRINECEYHHRRRTTKRPYRPKAECV